MQWFIFVIGAQYLYKFCKGQKMRNMYIIKNPVLGNPVTLDSRGR